jgi:hypothetical protein
LPIFEEIMNTAEYPNRRFKGFALVVTLSLMILLTVVAVGLLSLSTISLRSSFHGKSHAEARANARMALMMALGELQKELGPDQRVSATGAILSSASTRHPHWTGVWESWKAGPTASGLDATSEHQTILNASNRGMAPSYQARREDHFRSWLVSLNPDEVNKVSSPADIALGANAVELVGKGTLGATGAAQDFVSARLISVRTATGRSTGRYGWWVGDESHKARILQDSYDSTPARSMADNIFRQQAPGSTGTTTVKGLESVANSNQLKGIPSLKTLNLVQGATGKPSQNFHSITPFSYQVLADVREGGLKRDLSTLLERPISLTETRDEFMLYRFDTAGEERVPIQDLAAYYQMYDSGRDPASAKGVRYGSGPQNALLPRGFQVAAPDYYAGRDKNSFLREYTSLYRSPVPIKIQMVLAARAEAIDARAGIYGLRLGLAPAVTFWNPNNVPVVMNHGDPAFFSQQMRFNYAPFMITWNKNGNYIKPVSLAYAAMGGDRNTGKPGWGVSGGVAKATIFDMYFSGGQYPLVFEPGESRVMSYPYRDGTFEFKKKQNDAYNPDQLAGYGWKSEFLDMPFSAWGPNTDTNVRNNLLVISPSDRLRFNITTELENNVDFVKDSEAPGAGLNFMMIQKIFQSRPTALWTYRNYQFSSRTGGGTTTREFNDSLIRKGFPGGSGTLGDELPVGTMIANPGKWFAFLQFAMMAGTETSEASAGRFAGRKFASRPFLHASALRPPYIDRDDAASLYNSGWNWWVDTINSPDEAEVAVAPNRRSGYYGGGSTSFAGSTHVIQQEIPVVPPISIAALSHAHLGGFSIASNEPDLNNPRVTALGHGGLFPHTLQAIGNSYAHPLIPASEASTSWVRHFNTGSGQRRATLADHSYLANKALWDEFFFSSITPQPNTAQVFESGSNRSAKAVAEDFFFKDKPLPNRRMVPHKANLNPSKLDSLFSASSRQQFSGGLADQIAAHLMVDGPFNVNSTSVQAWKTVLSSLKGKPITYLDKDKALTAGISLDQATPNGTPVGHSTLPNGKPVTGSSSQPGDPEQWSDWRELTDAEITELATAMVKQVKLRGPFLSLSEFVNRRLDSRNEDLSVKGALQAALDDPSVSINSGFRSPSRQFSEDEINRVDPVFRKALEGPVAYGSAAYVDQADILRNFAGQLTPRGDTFVIRTYGDSLDAQGKVVARAWCEAVVQRIPEYADPADEPHLKQADLKSPANKSFGRKFELVSFRWLGPSEV